MRLAIILVAILISIGSGCSSRNGDLVNAEDKLRGLTKAFFQNDAKYYQISNFKIEHVFEKTDTQQVMLVSYLATIKPGDKASDLFKKKIAIMPGGFTRSLLVFRRIKDKHGNDSWALSDNRWNYLKARTGLPSVTDNLKLIAHSGYWQANYIEYLSGDRYDRYKTKKYYTIPNANLASTVYSKRSKENMKIVNAGGTPACGDRAYGRHKVSIKQYKKQMPIVLPQGKSIRLLLISKYVIYGFDVAFPRANDIVVPGYATDLRFDASKTGKYKAYYYRVCGKNIEYGVLPIHVVSKAEFKQWVKNLK